jgi:hypothetical protein
MSLARAIQGARRTGQTITWQTRLGTAKNLTGLTLTGRIRSKQTSEERAIDGILTIVSATDGTFTWAYGENDVGESGSFEVQFIGTANGQNDKSIPQEWKVYEAL